MMTKEELDLIARAKAGDETALDDLFKTYKQYVVGISRKYYLIGGDSEDLIQEGMMGLFRAIMSYDSKKNDNFKAYAYRVITNEILGAVRHNNIINVKILEDMMYLDEDDGIQYMDDELNPEDELLENEKVESILIRIKSYLSAFENEVLDLYLDGYNYHDIAYTLGLEDKKIDNALNRIKTKLRKNLKNIIKGE